MGGVDGGWEQGGEVVVGIEQRDVAGCHDGRMVWNTQKTPRPEKFKIHKKWKNSR